MALHKTYLLGICFLVIGSYPTHATPALAQLLQLGSFWSQRFLRRRHLLHALTLRKLGLCPAAALAAWSSVGDNSSVASAGSAELWRWRFAGCLFGDGESWRVACIALRGASRRREAGKGASRGPSKLEGGKCGGWRR